ncbi:MAG: HIT family protein [Acidimicrobiia bacterium]|nr:HIT family protein [Acidimicrobiia bacterium]MYB25259.1 HIT family protein [Acidimicrobiia bacterium]MYE67487.1 HIT family protein [Acidimicrobiia bacterium]
MATIFTRILNGELPGHIVWRDEVCGVFLSINPLTAGHSLVVPLAEVDHWLDLDVDTSMHLTAVAHRVGRAIMQTKRPQRVAVVIAGFEVPHVHVHVFGAEAMSDLDFANAAAAVDQSELATEAALLREALAGSD